MERADVADGSITTDSTRALTVVGASDGISSNLGYNNILINGAFQHWQKDGYTSVMSMVLIGGSYMCKVCTLHFFALHL